MPKRKLTPDESAAYRELSRAAAKLRKAQEAAEQNGLPVKAGKHIEKKRQVAKAEEGGER